MKKKVIGLVVATVIIAGMLGTGVAYLIDTKSGTDDALNAGTLDLNTNGGDTAVITFPATDVDGELKDGSGDLGGDAKVAAYVDMDGSGDWSDGDLALRSDGDGTYYLPIQ